MLIRILLGIAGAFIGLTLSWVLVGLATPGDYFGNGSTAIYVGVVASAVTGGALGFHIRPRGLRAALVTVGIVCALFWMTSRRGWWAKHAPPPPATD
jgi:hypothetical protein